MRTLPMLTLAALAACGRAEGDARQLLRASAGIRIVESAPPAWDQAAAWTVRITERFWPADIGVDEAPGALTGELGVEYIVAYEILKPSPGR